MWGWWDETACLILDIRLPAMGGLELQRYLADQQPDRPVIFISGQATENEQTRGMLKGAVAFLAKPFSDEALLQAVHKAVAQGQAAGNTTLPPNDICSLHHESANVVEAPSHMTLDRIELCAPAVETSKTLNAGRNEKEGPCSHCWKSCAGLGCATNPSISHVPTLSKRSND